MYLIQFTYDHYCQGYEAVTTTMLVYADSPTEACIKIQNRFNKSARDFVDLTIR